MREPTRFGPFLLLKKLTDDPIGEIYRAGRIDGESVGELILLRIFNLQGADAGEFVAEMRDIQGQSAAQQGPGITHAVECGEVGGVAYAAYDYFVGWSLPSVVEQANDGFSELERDYALLMAERVAKGLSGVHQIDPEKAPPFHGFLVPHNVLVSGDGEIRLIGFESGLALARIAARREGASPYLSPEVRGGADPGSADDVYALGGALWHLLTGEPPPRDIADGLTTRLASATTSSGEVLPAGLAELLQGSFAATRGRIPQAATWHQRLTDWMARNEVRTTHFDLAFFIHELFRQQIKKEEEEIAEEKQIDLRTRTGGVPIQSAAVGGPAATSESATETGIERPEFSGAVSQPELTGVVTRPDVTAAVDDPSRSRAGLWITVAAGVLVVAIAVGFYFLAPREIAAPPPPPPVAVPPPPSEPVVSPPSQELELAQQELQRLVEERTSSLGEEIAGEYDEQIRQLQEQLREARIAEEEAMRRVAERAAKARTKKPAPGEAPPAAVEAPDKTPANGADAPAEESPDAPPPTTAEPNAAEPNAAEPNAAEPNAEPNAAEPNVEPNAAEPDVPEPSADAPATGAETSAAAPPPPAESPPSAAPEASSPPSPAAAIEIVPPERLSMPDPVYPPQARQLRKEATVLVKVLVGPDGKVREAEPVIAKADPYGFQGAALRAARQAEFKPGTADGEPQEMWTTVVISFRY